MKSSQAPLAVWQMNLSSKADWNSSAEYLPRKSIPHFCGNVPWSTCCYIGAVQRKPTCALISDPRNFKKPLSLPHQWRGANNALMLLCFLSTRPRMSLRWSTMNNSITLGMTTCSTRPPRGKVGHHEEKKQLDLTKGRPNENTAGKLKVWGDTRSGDAKYTVPTPAAMVAPVTRINSS